MNKRITMKKQKQSFDMYLRAIREVLGKETGLTYGLPYADNCIIRTANLVVALEQKDETSVKVSVDFTELFDKIGNCYVQRVQYSKDNLASIQELLRELVNSNYHFGRSLRYETYNEVSDDEKDEEYYVQEAIRFKEERKKRYFAHLQMRDDFKRKVEGLAVVKKVEFKHDKTFNNIEEFKVYLECNISDDEVEALEKTFDNIVNEITESYKQKNITVSDLYYYFPEYFIPKK